jgi:hypothetical protein
MVWAASAVEMRASERGVAMRRVPKCMQRDSKLVVDMRLENRIAGGRKASRTIQPELPNSWSRGLLLVPDG